MITQKDLIRDADVDYDVDAGVCVVKCTSRVSFKITVPIENLPPKNKRDEIVHRLKKRVSKTVIDHIYGEVIISLESLLRSIDASENPEIYREVYNIKNKLQN